MNWSIKTDGVKEITPSHFFFRLVPLTLLPAGFLLANRRAPERSPTRESEEPSGERSGEGSAERSGEGLSPTAAPNLAPTLMESPTTPEPPEPAPRNALSQEAGPTKVDLRKLVDQTRRQIAEQLEASFEHRDEPESAAASAPDSGDEAAKAAPIYCVVLADDSPAPGAESEHGAAPALDSEPDSEPPPAFEPLELEWDPSAADLLSLYRRDYRDSPPPSNQPPPESTPWWKREAAYAVVGAILVGLLTLALLAAYFAL